MQQWTDASGTTWTARATVDSLCTFERLTGRRLLEEMYEFSKKAPEGEGGRDMLTRLFGEVLKDFRSLSALLYGLLDRKAHGGVTFSDFVSTLDGDALPLAMAAGARELMDFFQRATAGIELVLPTRGPGA